MIKVNTKDTDSLFEKALLGSIKISFSRYSTGFFQKFVKVLTIVISVGSTYMFLKEQETLFEILFLASIILNNIILHIQTKSTPYVFICKKSTLTHLLKKFLIENFIFIAVWSALKLEFTRFLKGNLINNTSLKFFKKSRKSKARSQKKLKEKK